MVSLDSTGCSNWKKKTLKLLIKIILSSYFLLCMFQLSTWYHSKYSFIWFFQYSIHTLDNGNIFGYIVYSGLSEEKTLLNMKI